MIKDAGLFSAAMADVKPLDGRRRLARAAAAVKITLPAAKPLPAKRTPTASDLSADDNSFDRDVARALSRGRLSPETTLDLHGMTLAAAERAVSRFLELANHRDFRVVLIVTGKGLREEDGRLVGGRIRAEFIGWLNRADNRARVRSVRPAHPHHGGSGAFYVLLRRRSSASSRSFRATPQR
jgi:DNA-nicking Smr family endonuclease